jgi:hypothetical protein
MKKINLSNLILLLSFLIISQGISQVRPTIQRELRLVNPSQAGTGFLALRSAEGTSTYTLSFPSSMPTLNSILKISAVNGSSSTLEWQSLNTVVTTAAWSLEGNNITAAGTATGQQFIGTTSAQPFYIATTHTTSQPIKFLTGNTERMRINADGKIGIGSALSATNTLEVGGSFKATGNTTMGGTVDVSGPTSLASTLSVSGEVSLATIAGVASSTIASGFDRIILANNAGILKQATIESVLTHNGYHLTKAKGIVNCSTAVESAEITPTNGQGTAISLDTNDAITLTLEGAAADMPIPSYYVSRNTGTGRFTIYFSSPFIGSVNWSILE